MNEPKTPKNCKEPKTFLATEHDLDHDRIDAEALYVIRKLSEAGHNAYLVGGSVRDLLVKETPKDFDVSTSATPEEIKKVFQRRCLLIGKRFRLAHIRFGNKVIEVSTFRSGENQDDLIVRDNIWGTPEEDARRRDFTINGLFYDPSTHCVIDYVGGWEDIHTKTLRSIGNAHMRFKQDPVRMIRLLKFRARFGFEVNEECKQALVDCREEIIKSSPARILEEMFRMLESGSSAQFMYLMQSSGLLFLLFPTLSRFLKEDTAEEVFRFLDCADQLNKARAPPTLDRALLTACLFFPIFKKEIDQRFLSKGQTPHLGDVTMLSSSLIRDVVATSFSHFPKRISSTVNYILATQYRLTPLKGKIHYRSTLFRNREFPLAVMLLKIRAILNSEHLETYNLWRKWERQNIQQQDKTGTHHPPPPKKRRRKPRGRPDKS